MSRPRLACVLLLVALSAARTRVRLADWHDDYAIWTAAATTDPDDPFALANAGHYARTIPEAEHWLLPILDTHPPAWLPGPERQPYIDGLMAVAHLKAARGDLTGANEAFLQAVQSAPEMFRFQIGAR